MEVLEIFLTYSTQQINFETGLEKKTGLVNWLENGCNNIWLLSIFFPVVSYIFHVSGKELTFFTSEAESGCELSFRLSKQFISTTDLLFKYYSPLIFTSRQFQSMKPVRTFQIMTQCFIFISMKWGRSAKFVWNFFRGINQRSCWFRVPLESNISI